MPQDTTVLNRPGPEPGEEGAPDKPDEKEGDEAGEGEKRVPTEMERQKRIPPSSLHCFPGCRTLGVS